MVKKINNIVKVILFFPLLIIGQDQQLWESKHHPVAHTHGNGIHNCRSYAVTSTFFSRDQIACNPETAELYDDEIPTSADQNSNEYFEFIPIPYLNDGNISNNEVSELANRAKFGDIILWGGSDGSGHAAVVIKVLNFPTLDPWYRIRINQMPNEGGEVEEDVPLFYTQGHSYGEIVGLARKRKLWKLKVENNFGYGYIGVNGSSGVIPSGEILGPFHWGTQFTLSAIEHEKTHNGDTQYFQYWQKTKPSVGEEINANPIIIVLSDHDMVTPTTYKATYFPMNLVNIKNDFIGVGNYGYLTVDDTLRQMPFSKLVNKDESIFISAPLNSQSYNHVDYDFTEWSTGNEAHTITVTPESDMTITAHYKGYPRSMAHYGISSGTVIGENISLNWNVHPNQNVSQYKIYREVKRKFGPWSQILLVGTVNRNTTSWEDPQYILTNGYSDDLLFYDVRPFYTIESTESKEDWTVTFGEEVQSEEFFKKRADGNFAIPDQYELTQNHPNPFNPVTTIRYSLPKDSHVRINVYNLKGQLVNTLVNQTKSAGYHTVSWNIKDNAREELAAGIYLYQIVTPEFTDTKKLVVMK